MNEITKEAVLLFGLIIKLRNFMPIGTKLQSFKAAILPGIANVFASSLAFLSC